MKTTFSILFYLRNNPNRRGLHSIMARITIDGRSVGFNTCQSVAPCNWDQTTQRVLGRKHAAHHLNLTLSTIRADPVKKYNHHRILCGEQLSARRLRSIYRGSDTHPSTLLAWFDCYNKKQAKIVGRGRSQSTHNKYMLTRRRLSSFIKSDFKADDIPMECIDLAFIMGFERYLRDEFGMCNNSVEKLMRIFRSIVLLAVYNGIITLDPFKHYKIKLERVERHYLTREELDRISDKHFTIERMERAKDIFLFCCFTVVALIDKLLVI